MPPYTLGGWAHCTMALRNFRTGFALPLLFIFDKARLLSVSMDTAGGLEQGLDQLLSSNSDARDQL